LGVHSIGLLVGKGGTGDKVDFVLDGSLRG